MSNVIVTTAASVTWELVEDPPKLRMLTSEELAKLQGFDTQYILESPPCTLFSKELLRGGE